MFKNVILELYGNGAHKNSQKLIMLYINHSVINLSLTLEKHKQKEGKKNY